MKPIVYMLCGLPGTGKTTYAKKKLKNLKRISVDELIFDKYGECGVDFSYDDLDKIFNDTEKDVEKEIPKLLKNKISFILDYGFWSKKERDEHKKLIEDNNGQWKLLYFKTDKEKLLKRLEKRNKQRDANSITVTREILDDYCIKQFEEPVNEGEILF